MSTNTGQQQASAYLHAEKMRSERFILVFILLAALFFALHHYTDVFYTFWRLVTLPLARCVAWFSNTRLGHAANHLFHHSPLEANQLVQYLVELEPKKLTWRGFVEVNTFLGHYVLLFFIPFGSIIALYTFRDTQSHSAKFLRLNDSEAYLKYLKASNPIAAELPDLTRYDIYQGKQASALSPIQFCEQHQLIKRHKQTREITYLKDKAAKKLFTEQLGRRFTNYEALKQQTYGWVLERILHKLPHQDHESALKEAATSHLYDYTVLMALLLSARRVGVVALADYIKLREENRTFWCALNNVGRKVAFIEGAGPMSQFLHEIDRQAARTSTRKSKPLINQVGAAVNGLIEFIYQEPLEG